MTTPVDGTIQSRGELQLSSPAFEDGERMPDYVGYANGNESPPLSIQGTPEDAESLVLVMDDPDAEPVVGHVYDHWLVWDIEPDVTDVPRGWDPAKDGATVGYNDYVEADWGGPAPPEGEHVYSFKLLALDSRLEMPPETRKARIGSAIAMEPEILGATQLTGTYAASQGTIF